MAEFSEYCPMCGREMMVVKRTYYCDGCGYEEGVEDQVADN